VRHTIRPLVAVAVLVSACVVGACTNPEVATKQWDEIQTLSASITELKAYSSDLESRLDSLNKIVARQDTALRLIVDFTGAQVPGYRPPN
jgi:hypothetical protein